MHYLILLSVDWTEIMRLIFFVEPAKECYSESVENFGEINVAK